MGKLNPDDLQPLLDMLLQCIKIKVGALESVLDPATIDGQIEEFKTLFELRKIALRLSFSFLLPDANFTSSEEKAAAEITNKQKISRIS